MTAVRALVAARGLRGLADGLVSVLLAGFLTALGFSPLQVGAVVTGTLLGSAALTLATGLGGRSWPLRTLLLAACGLMFATGVGFAVASGFVAVLVVSVVGTLNPSGGDVSVFLPTEQAEMADTLPAAERPQAYARYNLAGSVGAAVGALASGAVRPLGEALGWAEVSADRLGFLGYAAIAVAVAFLYRRLPRRTCRRRGLRVARRRSAPRVARCWSWPRCSAWTRRPAGSSCSRCWSCGCSCASTCRRA